MSTNTIIRLPKHATNEQIMSVIGRYVGSHSEKEGLNQPDCDFGLPCSENNTWHYLFFPKEEQFGIKAASHSFLSHGILSFPDITSQQWGWFFHQENEEDDWKTVRPGSHALAVAVGRRLVEFFGGEVVYSDCEEKDEPDFKRKNYQCEFPKRLKNQAPNSRFYQFQNALDKVSLISVQELDDGLRDCSRRDYNKSPLIHLRDLLVIKEEQDSLHKIFPSAIDNSTPRLRL